MKAIEAEQYAGAMENASLKPARYWKIFVGLFVELVVEIQTMFEQCLGCGLRPETCFPEENNKVLWRGYFVVLVRKGFLLCVGPE